MDKMSLIFSIITAITAITAIFIAVFQNLKSNKIALFERRLKVYLNVKWMKSLCEENKELCKSILEDAEKGVILTLDLLFVWMTNISYLEDIQGTMSHVLESEYQKSFLKKIEDLKNMCEESKLIFTSNIGYPLADFIFCYVEMLKSMYRYQIVMMHLQKDSIRDKKSIPENDKNENRVRAEVINYVSKVEKLSDCLFSEGTIKKIEAKLKM